MKLINKIFLFLFLFLFSLTTQSFASSKNDKGGTSQDKCEITQDFSKLGAEDKKKCKIWCQQKTYDTWVEKCQALGVDKPEKTDGASGADGAGGADGDSQLESLKDKMIKQFRELNQEELERGIIIPTINDPYHFDFTIGKDQRPNLIDMIPKKDGTIDIQEVKKAVKEIILDGLAYDDSNDDIYESLFINFRNKWLKFDAKGSIDNPNDPFEPFAFKTLAAANDHLNHTFIHKLYNMLEDDKKIFKDLQGVVDQDKIREELKKLHQVIIEFLKTNLNIEEKSKEWLENQDLVFFLRIGDPVTDQQNQVLNVVLADLFNKEAEFNKLRPYITIPTTLLVAPGGRQLFSYANGLAVLDGITFNYDLNPEKISLVAPNNNFSLEEKKTLKYKIYAARLHAIETYIRNYLSTVKEYVTADVENGSLLHNLTTIVRDAKNIAAVNNPNIMNYIAGTSNNTNKTVFKIGLVNNKIVILIHDNRDTHKTLIEFLNNNFAVGIPTSIVANTFDNNSSVTPLTDAEMVTEATFSQGLANALTNDDITVLNGITTLQNINGPSEARIVKFRISGEGNNRTVYQRFNNPIEGTNLQWVEIVTSLFHFQPYLINTRDAFGTTPLEAFKNLTKFDNTLGQLYAFNRFTIATMGNKYGTSFGITNLTNTARTYITSHVEHPAVDSPNNTTYAYTSKLRTP